MLGFLLHALPGFLRKIVDVVLRHQHFDAVHELLGGTRVPRENDALLHKVHLKFELIQRHPIFEIAIKPVGLFNQDGADAGMLFEILDHLAEVCAAANLRRLNIDKLSCDN
nr:hypothetical protein [Bradyrhizobium iriomotense]